jgi:hypothetical protein
MGSQVTGNKMVLFCSAAGFVAALFSAQNFQFRQILNLEDIKTNIQLPKPAVIWE